MRLASSARGASQESRLQELMREGALGSRLVVSARVAAAMHRAQAIAPAQKSTDVRAPASTTSIARLMEEAKP